MVRQETTVRVGVGCSVPLSFASAPLLSLLIADQRNRLYFEGTDSQTEEKYSMQLVEHELGEGVVTRLLAADSEETWREGMQKLRLGLSLAENVTVHREALLFHEFDLSKRVHPCLVRLRDMKPPALIDRLREDEAYFTALGIAKEDIKISTVLADWP
jgi:hypothetical protein